MLSNIWEVVKNLYRLVANTFTSLIALCSGLFQYSAVLSNIVSYLPAVIGSFITVSFAVLLVKFVLNRSN